LGWIVGYSGAQAASGHYRNFWTIYSTMTASGFVDVWT
jgi:hypothetical protein